MFGKKQKADGNKFARWEKYRISDEEAGTMVGGSLFASYKGLLRLAKQREGEEIGEDLRDKIKTDLMIVNNCISFVDLRDDQSYAFVITSQGQLKIGEYVPSIHYALAEGQSSVKAAGTLKLNKQGKITEVLNNSGHYQPLSADNNQVFAAFSNAGLLAPGARKINLDFPEDTYKV